MRRKFIFGTLMISGSLCWARTPSDPYPTGLTLAPCNSVYYTPVDSAPISTNSATWIDTINGHASHNFHPDFGSAGLTTGSTVQWNGIPYNLVWSTATSRQGVNLTTYANISDTPPVGGVPIPADAIAENDVVGSSLNAAASDQHLLLVDVSSGMLYEMFGATRTAAYANTWTAKGLWIFYSTSNVLPANSATSNAAGTIETIPILHYDEVYPTCAINHALAFTLQLTHGPHLWPATHDADSGGVLNPPLGMHVRMKASVDLSVLSDTTSVCIFNAIKKYGMFLTDNGGDWFIEGAPNLNWNDTTLHNDFITVGLPLNTMEVVDESTWANSINTSWAVISTAAVSCPASPSQILGGGGGVSVQSGVGALR